MREHHNYSSSLAIFLTIGIFVAMAFVIAPTARADDKQNAPPQPLDKPANDDVQAKPAEGDVREPSRSGDAQNSTDCRIPTGCGPSLCAPCPEN